MGSALLIIGLLLLAVGMPVAFAMGLASLLFMLIQGGIPLTTIPTRMLNGIDSFPLLAVPFFVLAGSLMNYGGVTRRLVAFSSALVGHLTGGLGHTTVIANMIMAGMSGSAVADATATGSILIPWMVRAGYSPRFAAAVTAAASTIGPIIPPSIAMVIFGSLTGVSTGRLFVGGVVPGVLMGLYLMLVCYLIAKRRGYGKGADFSWRRVLESGVDAILAMVAPIIVLGGILVGVFTPTEAAVVASVYALLLGLGYRELDWSGLRSAGTETIVTSGIVMLIVAASSVTGWIAALMQMPQAIVSFFTVMTDDPRLVLLIINLILLFLGCLMDPVPIMIITIPVFMPLIQRYHFDPVHFGVMMVLNLMIGMITPPVGMSMYITSTIAKISIWDFSMEVWPFIVALVVVLLMVTYWTGLVTFLPNALMGAR
ncbi:MAG: hypothetical protein A3H39_19470 [candidate division NC10 bacterium RIFCSPLOWO2_02_FULL_66_22]|nr:MAG: hypothetical protein A3H39_19470 [candidate division NC10 bacterium RIFCSPLOWO2_02_FULL_66_22]